MIILGAGVGSFTTFDNFTFLICSYIESSFGFSSTTAGFNLILFNSSSLDISGLDDCEDDEGTIWLKEIGGGTGTAGIDGIELLEGGLGTDGLDRVEILKGDTWGVDGMGGGSGIEDGVDILTEGVEGVIFVGTGGIEEGGLGALWAYGVEGTVGCTCFFSVFLDFFSS